MSNPFNLKSLEKQVFRTTLSDGLLDILIGCFVLMFSVAPLLSENWGDFWSSFVFLPFWGGVYLIIRLLKKKVVEPRLGRVKIASQRLKKIRKVNFVLIMINVVLLILGLLVVVNYGSYSNGQNTNFIFSTYPILGGLFLLVGFSVAAYLLDWSRLYVYGSLLFFAFPLGEWLSAQFGLTHHGFPLVFGILSGIIILTGIVQFVHLLRKNPVLRTEDDENEA